MTYELSTKLDSSELMRNRVRNDMTNAIAVLQNAEEIVKIAYMHDPIKDTLPPRKEFEDGVEERGLAIMKIDTLFDNEVATPLDAIVMGTISTITEIGHMLKLVPDKDLYTSYAAVYEDFFHHIERHGFIPSEGEVTEMYDKLMSDLAEVDIAIGWSELFGLDWDAGEVDQDEFHKYRLAQMLGGVGVAFN